MNLVNILPNIFYMQGRVNNHFEYIIAGLRSYEMSIIHSGFKAVKTMLLFE